MSTAPAPRRLAWGALRALVERNVHVVGVAGTEGASIARFLCAQGLRHVTAHDLAAPDALEAEFKRQHVGLSREARAAAWTALRALPVDWRLGDDYLAGVDAAEAVFAPQAWYLYPRNRAALGALRERGVPFYGLMDLYFGLSAAPIVAVTGSNGKSTTSRLIERILQATPHRTFYAGNERRSVQVLDALSDMAADDRLVLEVSNRHLIDLAPTPWIGVVTNVLPNHLDEHGGDLAAYAAVKRRLVAGVPADGWAVLNADNPPTAAMAEGLAAPVLWFSRRGRVARGAWLDGGRIWVRLDAGAAAEPVLAAADVPLVGDHNLENVLAAVAAGRAAGAGAAQLAEAVRTFHGLRHRTQLVWSDGGVRFYDDLNATSPQATVAALDALGHDGPARVVLLVGGDDKGLDLDALTAAVRRHVRWLVVLPGPGGERIAAAVEAATGAPATLPDGAVTASGADAAAAGLDAPLSSPVVERIDRLDAAVARVVEGARPGDVVLLSPACPYFFRRHYVDGGAEIGFRQLLRAAQAGRGGAPG